MHSAPLAGVDANLLVAVDALLAEEHVGRAAKRVGLSASAMSHALARARDLVGDPLLVRIGRNMVPTPRARAMAPVLRDGLARAAAALASPVPFDPRLEKRALRIAATDYALLTIGPHLAGKLADLAPDVDVVIHPFAGSFSELSSGDVDLAVAVHGTPRGIHSRAFLTEPFVCVLRRGHPALGKKLTVKRFAELGHVLISPRGRVRGAVDGALAERGLKRRVAFVSPTFLAAAQVVAASDLVLTCAARVARQWAPRWGLVVVPPPLPIAPFQLGMFWHERQERDPFLAWTRDLLVAMGAAESGPRAVATNTRRRATT